MLCYNTFPNFLSFMDYRELPWIYINLIDEFINNFNKLIHCIIIPM